MLNLYGLFFALHFIIQINQTKAYHYENTEFTSAEIIVHYSLNRTRRWKQKETRVGDDSNKTVCLRPACWCSQAATMQFSTKRVTVSIILIGLRYRVSVGQRSTRIVALLAAAGSAEAKSTTAERISTTQDASSAKAWNNIHKRNTPQF